MESNTEYALITGASLGIGREIVWEFAELMRGFACRVLLWYIFPNQEMVEKRYSYVDLSTLLR